ncbi:MAG: hypothetical protein KF734_03655 [Saprospiraceae bacterium]|nr:hypothetical protein [Saprospiraceae bacterium]
MKTLCTLACFLILFFSCKKEPLPSEPQGPWWGDAAASKDNIIWEARPYAVVSKNFPDRVSILIDSLDRNNFLRERLSFYRVPPIKGTYPVLDAPPGVEDSLVRSKFFYVDVDILYGVYKILEADSSSFITVTSYDTVSKELKGTFDVTFITEIKPYAGAPDTIRLRNGSFHTKVIK